MKALLKLFTAERVLKRFFTWLEVQTQCKKPRVTALKTTLASDVTEQ